MDAFAITVAVIAIAVIGGVLTMKFGWAPWKERRRPAVELELRIRDTGDSIEILVGDLLLLKKSASREILDQFKKQLTSEEFLKYISGSNEALKDAIDQDILGIRFTES